MQSQGSTVGTLEDALCLPRVSQAPAWIFFLYHPGPPAKEWYHPQWTGLSYINRDNKDNHSEVYPQVTLIRINWDSFLKKVILGCVKMTVSIS